MNTNLEQIEILMDDLGLVGSCKRNIYSSIYWSVSFAIASSLLFIRNVNQGTYITDSQKDAIRKTEGRVDVLSDILGWAYEQSNKDYLPSAEDIFNRMLIMNPNRRIDLAEYAKVMMISEEEAQNLYEEAETDRVNGIKSMKQVLVKELDIILQQATSTTFSLPTTEAIKISNKITTKIGMYINSQRKFAMKNLWNKDLQASIGGEIHLLNSVRKKAEKLSFLLESSLNNIQPAPQGNSPH